VVTEEKINIISYYLTKEGGENMDKDTFLAKIMEIGTITDDVERRTKLTEITDGVSEVYDNVDNLNATINSLNENLTKVNGDLEKANKANMDLFLRVGEQKTQADVNQTSTGVEKEPQKRKFEDLFKSEEGDDK